MWDSPGKGRTTGEIVRMVANGGEGERERESVTGSSGGSLRCRTDGGVGESERGYMYIKREKGRVKRE